MNKEQEISTPNFDKVIPPQCINNKLRKLHRLLNAVYQAKFKPYGLRGSMVSILFIIGKRKKINQKAIAEMLVLDPSTMSRDLKKLVERKLVEVGKGEDPRNSELELTLEGYRLLEEISPIWLRLQEKVNSVLGSFNVQQIDLLIEAVKSNLAEIDS